MTAIITDPPGDGFSSEAGVSEPPGAPPGTTPRYSARVFRAPKDAEALSTCADAVAVHLAQGSFAIADGVSDTLRSGEWARWLVNRFVEADASEVGERIQNPAALQLWIDSLRPEYAANLEEWLTTKSFFQRLKAQESGSQATFLAAQLSPHRSADAVELTGAAGWTLHTVAVGDCCLLLFDSENQLTHSFPVSDAADFNTRPQVVGSRVEHGPGAEQIQYQRVAFTPGTWLVLATDALAARLLMPDTAPLAWSTVCQWTADDFGAWITAERAGRRLKDDDTTLLLVWEDPLTGGTFERLDWEEAAADREARVAAPPPPIVYRPATVAEEVPLETSISSDNPASPVAYSEVAESVPYLPETTDDVAVSQTETSTVIEIPSKTLQESLQDIRAHLESQNRSEALAVLAQLEQIVQQPLDSGSYASDVSLPDPSDTAAISPEPEQPTVAPIATAPAVEPSAAPGLDHPPKASEEPDPTSQVSRAPDSGLTWHSVMDTVKEILSRNTDRSPEH